MKNRRHQQDENPPVYELPDIGRICVIERTTLPDGTKLLIGKSASEADYYLILPFASMLIYESWLFSKVSKSRLDRLIQKKMTVYTAFRCPEFTNVLLVRRNRFLRTIQTARLEYNDLPDEFLPKTDCYLAIGKTEL